MHRSFLRLDGLAFPTTRRSLPPKIQTKGKCRMLNKRVFALLLALVMMFAAVPAVAVYGAPNDTDTSVSEDATQTEESTENEGDSATESTLASSDIKVSGLSFKQFKEQNAGAANATQTVEIDPLAPSAKSEAVKVEEVLGEQAIVIDRDHYVEFTVTVNEDAIYVINTRYCLPGQRTIDGEFKLSVDGVVPYTEATTVTLSRVWKDAEYDKDANLNKYGHEADVSGNELTPDAQVIECWQDYILHDNDYMTDSDLELYLTAGTHVIRFDVQREQIAFSKLSLTAPTSLPTYKDVLAGYKDKGYAVYEGEAIVIEAENSYERSEQSLTMATDYASAATSPSHPSQARLNTIGGELWDSTGQWISWNVNVKKAGLYSLSFKYRQDFVRGFKVYRSIAVNGEVPYAEFDCVPFNSNTKWENYTASNDKNEPFYIYLEEGDNTITLTNTLGPVADSLQLLNETIAEMNAIYLEIIKITGTSPDANRDYDIDKAIPDLMERFRNVRKSLESINKGVAKYNGNVDGGITAFIDIMVKQLNKFDKDPVKITSALGAYKSNISSISDMLRSMSEQSILLDRIYIGGEKDLPSSTVGFFTSMAFSFKSFFASFVTDYNAFGNVYDDKNTDGYVCEPIEVWMSSGRDQMNILKTMIDDQFVKEYKIPVNLSLVDVNGSLTKAILAGIGPDCAVMVASATPVNYSMRGALEDMNQFNAENQYTTKDGKKVQNYRYTFDEVKEEFFPSAFIALQYQDGKTYGLPETQTFNMMFYRTDVLESLGLEPPQTWQDLYNCITVIQRQNMNIGIPTTADMFSTMLFQRGGTYFVDDYSAVNFNTNEAIDAFRQWTEFNTKYSMPLSYDPLNRFRAGEYPIIVTNYTFYNNLAVGAPEIKGLWEMTAIPGIEQEDGTINRSQPCEGLVSVMIKGCDNKNQVYDFMTWWVSASTQAEFGNKIEARLGIGGRYTTANKEAFKRLSWSTAEQQEIMAAWEHVTDYAKIPGDYYITRMINNAFRAVVYKNQNPREAMLRYSTEMDKEIQRKRVEYNVEEIRKAAGLD